MWSFLRLVLIFGAYQGVEATTGWHRREARPWDFSSLKMEVFVNPMYEGLQSKMKNMWKTSAIETYDTCQAVLFESLFAYACSLLVRMWHQCCEDGDFPDINYVSYAKRLAECPTEDVPGLIEKIKQKERDMKGEAPQSPRTCVFLANFPYTLFNSFFLFSWFLDGPSRGAGSPSGADGNMELLELHNM